MKILPHGQTNPVHSIVQWYSRSQSWNKEAPLLFRRHNWVSWHYRDFFLSKKYLSVRPMPCVDSRRCTSKVKENRSGPSNLNCRTKDWCEGDMMPEDVVARSFSLHGGEINQKLFLFPSLQTTPSCLPTQRHTWILLPRKELSQEESPAPAMS